MVYNAALLAGQNIGYILNPNKLVNAKDRTVCFRPFTPALKAGLGIVWEKYRFFHLLQIFNALQKIYWINNDRYFPVPINPPRAVFALQAFYKLKAFP